MQNFHSTLRYVTGRVLAVVVTVFKLRILVKIDNLNTGNLLHRGTHRYANL